MVLILDGNSENVAHTLKKIKCLRDYSRSNLRPQTDQTAETAFLFSSLAPFFSSYYPVTIFCYDYWSIFIHTAKIVSKSFQIIYLYVILSHLLLYFLFFLFVSFHLLRYFSLFISVFSAVYGQFVLFCFYLEKVERKTPWIPYTHFVVIRKCFHSKEEF